MQKKGSNEDMSHSLYEIYINQSSSTLIDVDALIKDVQDMTTRDQKILECCNRIKAAWRSPGFKHDPKHIQTLWKIWRESENEKKVALGELISTYISMRGDLSAMAAPVTSDKYFLLLCISLSYFIAWNLRQNERLWGYLLIAPIAQVALLSSSMLAGWYATNYIKNFVVRHVNKDQNFIIDGNLLKGSYINSSMWFKSGSAIPDYIAHLETRANLPDQSSAYAISNNLLYKYAELLNPARMYNPVKILQLHKYQQQLGQQYIQHRIMLEKQNTTRFLPKFGESLKSPISRTFTPSNFNAILAEVESNDDAKKSLLGIYELADKGMLSISLKSMYVLFELAHSVVFPDHQSPLRGAKNSTSPQQLSFKDFTQVLHTTIALEKYYKKNDSDITEYKNAIKNFTHNSSVLLQAIPNEKKAVNINLVDKLNKLDKSWHQWSYIKGDTKLLGEPQPPLLRSMLDTLRITSPGKPIDVNHQLLNFVGTLTTLAIGCITYRSASSALRLPFFASVFYLCFPKQVNYFYSLGSTSCIGLKTSFDKIANSVYNASSHRVLGAQ